MAASVTGAAANLSERDPMVPSPLGTAKVRSDDGDLAGVDPEPVRDQLGEGGLVALGRPG